MNLNLDKKKSEPIETTVLSQVLFVCVFFFETKVKFRLFIVLAPFPPSKPWPCIEQENLEENF